jgi:hypothetical protein
MRRFARTSLGLLGLVLIAPITASAQDAPPSAPAGYLPPGPAPATSPDPAGPDSKPLPPPAAEAPHQHNGRTYCAKCAAKMAGAMPRGKIVGCAHSKNGVCTACQAALNQPGQFIVSGGPAPEAPGRAVASSGPAGAASDKGGSAIAYGGGPDEPVPVGVVQANYSPYAPTATSAAYAPQAAPPGRAVAESTSGHEPYQTKSSGFPRPHILGHIFGWSVIGADRAEERARRKAETHAMISYDSNGNSSTTVEDLPASAVYGKKR